MWSDTPAPRACSVRMWRDGALRLEIRDDGSGLPDGYRAGMGLHSIRERAAELGGEAERGPRGDRRHHDPRPTSAARRPMPPAPVEPHPPPPTRHRAGAGGLTSRAPQLP